MMKALSQRHRVWLSDVWGVVHNGQKPVASTIDVMKQHRATGGLVVLITNAPRLSHQVIDQMDGIGVDRAAYDAVVTSGDVTRALVAKHGGSKTFHIGNAAERSLFSGLQIETVALAEAQSVVCSGLFNDSVETPDDYRDMLIDIYARKLVMICANPDIVVRIGDTLRFCGGAIAAEYAKMGGTVMLAGKPHPPIYDLAIEKATELRGGLLSRDDIMVIGDGPDTDIKGAVAQDLPAVFLVAGILEGQSPEAATADVMKSYPAARLLLATEELRWA
jgi:HAD superfamily hydrolase (TIGR01459 family)